MFLVRMCQNTSSYQRAALKELDTPKPLSSLETRTQAFMHAYTELATRELTQQQFSKGLDMLRNLATSITTTDAAIHMAGDREVSSLKISPLIMKVNDIIFKLQGVETQVDMQRVNTESLEPRSHLVSNQIQAMILGRDYEKEGGGRLAALEGDVKPLLEAVEKGETLPADIDFNARVALVKRQINYIVDNEVLPAPTLKAHPQLASDEGKAERLKAIHAHIAELPPVKQEVITDLLHFFALVRQHSAGSKCETNDAVIAAWNLPSARQEAAMQLLRGMAGANLSAVNTLESNIARYTGIVSGQDWSILIEDAVLTFVSRGAAAAGHA